MNPLWCPHSLTTEPDEKGDGICLRCGTLVSIRMTLEKLQAAMKSLRDAA